MSITIKDEAGIAGMREACRIASQVLDDITPHIRPGITTLDIDRLSASQLRERLRQAQSNEGLYQVVVDVQSGH